MFDEKLRQLDREAVVELSIEAGEWFVEQKNRVILCDALGNINPLPLTTRQPYSILTNSGIG